MWVSQIKTFYPQAVWPTLFDKVNTNSYSKVLRKTNKGHFFLTINLLSAKEIILSDEISVEYLLKLGSLTGYLL